jgi:hypothetical protein
LNCIFWNKLYLLKKAHRKLHKWIEKGAIISKDINGIPVNSGKSKLRCKICNKPLKLKQRYYCSIQCTNADKKSKMEGVDPQEVLDKLVYQSFVQVAKNYGISDNGLRKWLKTKHNLDKTTLSQALSTLREGAETSGGVKSP